MTVSSPNYDSRMNTNREFLAELERGEWICVAEAARLIPSMRPGKRTQPGTVVRWIEAGRLPGRRCGRSWFVRREDVAGLFDPPTESPAARSTRRLEAAERRRKDEENDRILRSYGVR